jgi:hypothetical protein
VQGALFAAEVNAVLTNRARILFFKLRTQAHWAAETGSATGGGGARSGASVWLDYDELEMLLDENEIR